MHCKAQNFLVVSGQRIHLEIAGETCAEIEHNQSPDLRALKDRPVWNAFLQ